MVSLHYITVNKLKTPTEPGYFVIIYVNYHVLALLDVRTGNNEPHTNPVQSVITTS